MLEEKEIEVGLNESEWSPGGMVGLEPILEEDAVVVVAAAIWWNVYPISMLGFELMIPLHFYI